MTFAAGAKLWYNTSIQGNLQIPNMPIVRLKGTDEEETTFDGARAINMEVELDHAGNTSNGMFVAPVSGIYQILFSANLSALPEGQHSGFVQVCRNSDSDVLTSVSADSSITTESVTSSLQYFEPLDAGDTVYLVGSNAVIYTNPPPYLGISLVTTLYQFA